MRERQLQALPWKWSVEIVLFDEQNDCMLFQNAAVDFLRVVYWSLTKHTLLASSFAIEKIESRTSKIILLFLQVLTLWTLTSLSLYE